ncbi:MAG: class I SAM-dependent methyltransferase, partial [Lentisphaerota bacterium]
MVMHRTTLALPEEENTDEVRSFFNNWKIYHKLVEHNYISHKQVYALLHGFLEERFPSSFSMLDLGCGDAGYTAGSIRHTAIQRYTGVDLAPTALKLAERHLHGLKCRKEFVCADFSLFIETNTAISDMVWIGLSMHHLSKHQKDAFVGRVRKAIGAKGCFMIFEPMLREDEDRNAFLD